MEASCSYRIAGTETCCSPHGQLPHQLWLNQGEVVAWVLNWPRSNLIRFPAFQHRLPQPPSVLYMLLLVPPTPLLPVCPSHRHRLTSSWNSPRLSFAGVLSCMYSRLIPPETLDDCQFLQWKLTNFCSFCLATATGGAISFSNFHYLSWSPSLCRTDHSFQYVLFCATFLYVFISSMFSLASNRWIDGQILWINCWYNSLSYSQWPKLA